MSTFKSTICIVLSVATALLFFSFKIPPPEPVLKFKTMVISKGYLLSTVFTGDVSEVVFQHKNARGGGEGATRHRYHLIAYAKHSDGTFTKINQASLFVNRTTPPLFTTISISGQGATSNFGNLNLKKTSITSEDPGAAYGYIVLEPELLSDDKDYIRYKMYFAETPNDDDTNNNKLIKRTITISFALNPSPPR